MIRRRESWAYQDDDTSVLDAVIGTNGEELWCYEAGLQVIELCLLSAGGRGG